MDPKLSLSDEYMKLVPGGKWPEGYFKFDNRIWRRKIDGGAFNRAYREACTHTIYHDDIVMDFGACLGGFSARAIQMGTYCIAVEAHEETAALLRLNVPKAECVWGAVCSTGTPTVPLYLRTWGICSNTHSIDPSRGRKVLHVPAVDFRTLLLSRHPTVLKMDIEGGEYSLDWTVLDDWKPRIMQIEHHLTKGWMKVAGIELMETILAAGYKRTSEVPNFERVMAVISYARNV